MLTRALDASVVALDEVPRLRGMLKPVRAVRHIRRLRRLDHTLRLPTATSLAMRLVSIQESLAGFQAVHLHSHWRLPTLGASLLAEATPSYSHSISVHAHESVLEPTFISNCSETASAITSCNSATHRRVEELSQHTDRLHLIYHGVDTDLFQPSDSLPLPTDSFRLIAVGRFDRGKRLGLVAEALSLMKSWGDCNVSLLYVGLGSELDGVRAYVDSHGLSAQVTFEGWLKSDELSARLAGCDLLVCPSDPRLEYGLPNVILEALASGIPVLASGIEAAKIDLKTCCGIIFFEDKPSSNAKVIADELCRIRGLSSGERTRLRTAARSSAVLFDQRLWHARLCEVLSASRG